ncbi:hypothetical protein Q4574_12950 [Aliiglaciecola sp. 3_MG-2023]|uniref:hypothetical protein n=1 Tax=Aliiglaciecola sp. 3_MG-2023 TaxID=3062644 RepID=UPI0026E3C400|nr:hypothetical protein [Aliiglaciecola sp. 3_MG-2023]MDO6694194.1 hypothetical protein [Aliiglaciecola sp. 3_MG-2023]
MHRLYIICLALMLVSSTFASDVLISAGSSEGQGFLYEHEDICYVVTPFHVVKDSSEPSVLTAENISYRAELLTEFETEFEFDLALLSLIDKPNICHLSTFRKHEKLTQLLNILEEGILKTKLEDGSTQQVLVNIIGVENTTALGIRSALNSDTLKQGFSGSLLYIANLPAGILYEIEDDVGYVYRYDVVSSLLDDYFYPNGVPTDGNEGLVIGKTTLQSTFAKGQTKEYTFDGQANSAIELENLKTDKRVDYRLAILDENGIQKAGWDIGSGRHSRFAFTPLTTGSYTIRLTGTNYSGNYKIKLHQWSINSDLRGEANLLDKGDAINGRFAIGSIAEYRFRAQENSPIILKNYKTDKRVDFKLQIVNERGKTLKQWDIGSGRAVNLPFTPPKSGLYTVRLVANNYHGLFNIGLNQWALNSDLRGDANKVNVGDTIQGQFAEGSIAEYSLEARENSAIVFDNLTTQQRVDFKFQIINERGKTLKQWDIGSGRAVNLPFTPPKSGLYTVRLVANNYHGLFNIGLNQWALNSDLRGDANKVNVGDTIQGQFAEGSIAEYQLEARENSPIVFESLAAAQRVFFTLAIIDKQGKTLRQWEISTRKNANLPFTPPKSGLYTVRLTATKGYGEFNIGLNQWALNSDLRGDANKVKVGDIIQGQFAEGSIAEYQLEARENSPIVFESLAAAQRVFFTLAIIDKQGKTLRQWEISTRKNANLPFTPPKSALYTVRLIATGNYGPFHLLVSQP